MSEAGQELLAKYTSQRNAETFRELTHLHKDMVYAACHRVLRHDADTEDAVQTCFLALARKPEQVKGSVAAWLHRVALNAAIELLRQNRARRRHEEKAMRHEAVLDEPTWEQIAPDVDEAINDLPEELRVPVIRYYLEGHKQEKIARELHVTHSAVSKRLQRATEELRQRLTKAGVTLSVAALATLLSAHAAEAAPAAITAALGKIALVSMSAAGKSAVTAGGISIMKTGAIVAALSAAVVGIGIAVHTGNGEPPKPPLAVALPPPTTAQPEPAPITPVARAENVQFIEYRWSGGRSPDKSAAVSVEAAGNVHVQVSKYSGKETEYRTTLSEAELGYLRMLVRSSGFFNERGEERLPARVGDGGETELQVAMDGKENSVVFGSNRNLTALTSALLRLRNQGEMIENLKTGENIYDVLSGVSLRYGGTKALQPQAMVRPLEEFIERAEDGQEITWALEALSFVVGPEEWVGFIAVQLEKVDPERRWLLDQMITGHPFYANIPDSHLAALKLLLALEVAAIEAVPETTRRQTSILRQMKYLLRNKDGAGGE